MLHAWPGTSPGHRGVGVNSGARVQSISNGPSVTPRGRSTALRARTSGVKRKTYFDLVSPRWPPTFLEGTRPRGLVAQLPSPQLCQERLWRNDRETRRLNLFQTFSNGVGRKIPWGCGADHKIASLKSLLMMQKSGLDTTAGFLTSDLETSRGARKRALTTDTPGRRGEGGGQKERERAAYRPGAPHSSSHEPFCLLGGPRSTKQCLRPGERVPSATHNPPRHGKLP
jgi:hypothetical protein